MSATDRNADTIPSPPNDDRPIAAKHLRIVAFVNSEFAKVVENEDARGMLMRHARECREMAEDIEARIGEGF